jgi:hypothetical protein
VPDITTTHRNVEQLVSRSNTIGGALFESPPDTDKFEGGFLGVPVYYLEQATIVSFQILSTLLFTNHCTIQRYSARYSVVIITTKEYIETSVHLTSNILVLPGQWL